MSSQNDPTSEAAGKPKPPGWSLSGKLALGGCLVPAALLVIAYLRLLHGWGVWPEPPMPDFPRPDETGFLEAERFDLSPWPPATDDQGLERYEFGFVVKQVPGEQAVFIRSIRSSGYGGSEALRVNESTADWASDYFVRYDVAQRTLAYLPASAWPAEPQSIRCASQRAADIPVIRPDEGDLVRASNSRGEPREISAVAGNIVLARRSPSKKKALVMSASGEHDWRALGWPFPYGLTKTRGAAGRHYQRRSLGPTATR